MAHEQARAHLAILTRAAIIEAQRQTAEQRGDRMALDAATVELERLWARYVDLARDAGLDAVRRPPRS